MTDVTQPTAVTPSQIDAPFNPKTANEIAVVPGKGILLETMAEMVEGAKLMARAGICVPPHCRDNPGVCFAILYKTNALSLKDPFWVADHSYPVVQRKKVDGQWGDVETLAFDSTVFHAAVEVSGVLKEPLRCEFEGEGMERTCTVFGTFKNSATPYSLKSPPLKTIHPGWTEKDGKKYVKGSPLYDKDPDQQQFYWTVRNWVRRFCPHVGAGIYDKDEFEEAPLDAPSPQTPNLLDRLPGRMEGDGIGPHTVEDATAETPKPKPRKPKAPAAAPSPK